MATKNEKEPKPNQEHITSSSSLSLSHSETRLGRRQAKNTKQVWDMEISALSPSSSPFPVNITCWWWWWWWWYAYEFFLELEFEHDLSKLCLGPSPVYPKDVKVKRTSYIPHFSHRIHISIPSEYIIKRKKAVVTGSTTGSVITPFL